MTTTSVTNEEIADFVEGISDAPTSRRVLAAALTDDEVRSRIAALEALDADFARHDEPVATSGFSERAARLKTELSRVTGLVARERPERADETRPRRTASLIQEAGEVWRTVVDRALVIGRRQVLALPCLAPATAASAVDLVLRRQSLTTGDGVRIEFQQLPGPPPYRVRVIVDASSLQDRKAYDIACLSLEQGVGDESEAVSTLPERHVLILVLNDQGRGVGDYVVGSGDLPAPRSLYQLVAVTLSHSSL